jgi:hypothetical protein
MTFEELFAYYDKNLTFYRLVICKNGWLKNTTLAITFIAYLVLMTFFLFTSENLYVVMGLSSIAIGTLLGRIFNRQTIKARYNEKVKTTFWGWSNSDFNRMTIDKLKKHLEKENYCDPDKLERVVSLIQNKVTNERLPSILVATTFAGLFIPLWSSYLGQNMQLANGFKETSLLFVIWLVFILFIALLTPAFIDIRDSLLTRQLKLLRLQELINEIILRAK